MKNFLYPAVLAVMAAAALAGCATPESIVQQPLSTRPQPVAAPAPANGAIFQSASYRPMLEDRRARHVGDIMTIAINERTSAGKSTSNSASKEGDASASVTNLLNISAGTLGNLGVNAANERSYEERGAASSSNTFSGTITVTVAEVLANGNLVVSGEKQIAFDKGVEYVRFSGIVNPVTIGAGNVVSSTQVADARVEYRTSSRIDRAELMSQIVRFFFSVAPL
jgi:flagellar L-ring protein precursor FlgH